MSGPSEIAGDQLRTIVERREVRDATLAPADGAASTTADASIRYDSPTAEKVTLFRSLFRGREDIYPIRWESKAGRSGYSPACNNDRRAGGLLVFPIGIGQGQLDASLD